MNDEAVVFSDELEVADPGHDNGLTWNLLVIDDDQDVHNVTEFVMHGVSILGRRLKFLHAYSAAEGRAMLKEKQDIAVILLDVVMESETAGLTLVKTIREELGYSATRIILHTGQPGYAPEYEAIRDYDINDYRNKSELNYSRLLTSLTAAIRAYMQIQTVAEQYHGVEFMIKSAPRLFSQTTVASFPEELVRELQGLLASAIDCVVLSVPVRASEDFSRLLVCHATGSWASLAPPDWEKLASGELKERRSAIESVIRTGTASFGGNWACLFIDGLQFPGLCVYLQMPGQLNPAQDQLLTIFGVMISVGYQNLLLLRQLSSLAYRDATSGLLNRNGFIRAVDEARAAEQKDLGLALIDIDGFSEINEVLGHDFGDELLKAIGQRISEVFPVARAIARVSADGFAILDSTAMITKERITEVFSQPLTVQQHSMYLRFVCGMVFFADVGGDGADLVKDAFIAVKTAKLQQKTRFFQYKSQFEVETRQKLLLLEDLQRSLVKGNLEVYYQPQVDIASTRLTGLEALIRWRRDDGSFVSPASFIPLAEQSGLIVEIGDWVLEQACKHVLQWQGMGIKAMRVAVNISVRQFYNPSFLDSLQEKFQRFALKPEDFELEITESMAMHDVETILDLLGKLKSMGFYLAIDDFGTGFSSLSYLQQLPIDRLKIDRSFVMAIHEAERNRAIAELIVGLGKSLGLSVIAEGVEVIEQSNILTQLGCGEAQGYYYGKPMSHRDVSEYLIANHK